MFSNASKIPTIYTHTHTQINKHINKHTNTHIYILSVPLSEDHLWGLQVLASEACGDLNTKHNSGTLAKAINIT